MNNSSVCQIGCFWLVVAVNRSPYQTNKWTVNQLTYCGWKWLLSMAQLQTSQWQNRKKNSRWLIDCNARISKLTLTALNVNWHYKWEERRNKTIRMKAIKWHEGTIEKQLQTQREWGHASKGMNSHPFVFDNSVCHGPSCSLYFLSYRNSNILEIYLSFIL